MTWLVGWVKIIIFKPRTYSICVFQFKVSLNSVFTSILYYFFVESDSLAQMLSDFYIGVQERAALNLVSTQYLEFKARKKTSWNKNLEYLDKGAGIMGTVKKKVSLWEIKGIMRMGKDY